jgi:hypothetical protein
MSSKSLPPFISKLNQLMSDSTNYNYVAWNDDGVSFTVSNPGVFASEILPKHFKHNNFCSFIRQLNIYGFHKSNTEKWSFKHEEEYFNREDKSKLSLISRRKQIKRKKENLSEKVDKEPKVCEGISPKSDDVHQINDEVKTLRRVNDSLVNELNSLKTIYKTQDNQVRWLIQELQQVKCEVKNMKIFMDQKIQPFESGPVNTAPTPPPPKPEFSYNMNNINNMNNLNTMTSMNTNNTMNHMNNLNTMTSMNPMNNTMTNMNPMNNTMNPMNRMNPNMNRMNPNMNRMNPNMNRMSPMNNMNTNMNNVNLNNMNTNMNNVNLNNMNMNRMNRMNQPLKENLNMDTRLMENRNLDYTRESLDQYMGGNFNVDNRLLNNPQIENQLLGNRRLNNPQIENQLLGPSRGINNPQENQLLGGGYPLDDILLENRELENKVQMLNREVELDYRKVDVDSQYPEYVNNVYINNEYVNNNLYFNGNNEPPNGEFIENYDYKYPNGGSQYESF